MIAAHSSGPWTWEDGQAGIMKNWSGKDHQVASVDYKKLAWHEDSNCAGRESGANARLIAAAPDLLASLIYLRDCIESGRDPAMGDVNAVIAKAQGKP